MDEPRLARCRCLLIHRHNFRDRCPAQVPLDQPFCRHCELTHHSPDGKAAMEAVGTQVLAVPPGQP